MNTELQYWFSMVLIIGGTLLIGLIVGYKAGVFVSELGESRDEIDEFNGGSK